MIGGCTASSERAHLSGVSGVNPISDGWHASLPNPTIEQAVGSRPPATAAHRGRSADCGCSGTLRTLIEAHAWSLSQPFVLNDTWAR
jgi:hypothetical protein